MMTETELVGLVAAPRSGTHFLASLLDSHPEIVFYGEVFNPVGKDPARQAGRASPSWNLFHFNLALHGSVELPNEVATRVRRVEEYLDTIMDHPGARWVGLDLKYWTWSSLDAASLRLVGKRVRRWIHLVRRDLTRSVLSDVVRERFHDRIDKDSPVTMRIGAEQYPLVATLVERRAREIAAFRRALAGAQTLEVVYEDLFPDPSHEGSGILPAQEARILEFLGVSAAPGGIRTERRKANPTDMRQRISDYEEIVDFVEKTVGPTLDRDGLRV